MRHPPPEAQSPSSTQTDQRGEERPNPVPEASRKRRLLLSLSRAYDSMSSVLGLRELKEYLQGHTALPLSAEDLWLLGVRHVVAEAAESDGEQTGSDPLLHEEGMTAFLADFSSRIWVTYRREFPEILSSGITSDVGWGCTLRSGQMLLAEALLRTALGREWRWADGSQQALGVAQMFFDKPGADAPLSIQEVCNMGQSHGIVPGEWIGPYVICKTLAAVASSAALDLSIHVVSEPGGGAPTLYQGAAAEEKFPRLLLIPLTLGIGKMNPVYFPSLRSIFKLPQSVGIIGGRPGSSHYFIGFQGDHMLYLDPHFTRPAASCLEDLPTFRCDTVRHLHIASMDPSLAIGLYCESLEDYAKLCAALVELEAQCPSAPILTVRDGPAPVYKDDCDSWADDDNPESPNGSDHRGGDGGDNWELM